MNKAWSGERLETFIYNISTIEHLHRYALACSICKNLTVLDIASGEGYGTNLLSMVALKVTGVDISQETVEHAKKKYKRNNLSFRVGSAAQMPIDTNSIDVVVSFETIEHHDKHQEMMDEIKRVLKPNGILIISSPDKKYYSDVPNYNNPFHVKELYFEEFKKLISSNFAFSNFFYQKVINGSLLIQETGVTGFVEYEGGYERLQLKESFSPVYNLCIASDSQLSDTPSSLFDGKNVIDNAVSETEERYKNTWSYRIGHSILYPIKLIRKMLGN